MTATVSSNPYHVSPSYPPRHTGSRPPDPLQRSPFLCDLPAVDPSPRIFRAVDSARTQPERRRMGGADSAAPTWHSSLITGHKTSQNFLKERKITFNAEVGKRGGMRFVCSRKERDGERSKGWYDLFNVHLEQINAVAGREGKRPSRRERKDMLRAGGDCVGSREWEIASNGFNLRFLRFISLLFSTLFGVFKWKHMEGRMNPSSALYNIHREHRERQGIERERASASHLFHVPPPL